MKNHSNRAAAQTASIGNQDMMTFMPSPVAAAAEGSPPGSPAMSGNTSRDEAAPPSPGRAAAAAGEVGDADSAVPDPLRDPLLRTPFMDRGESMDDEAFNASLDALLKEACADDSQLSLGGMGIMGPPPPPASVAAAGLLPPGGTMTASNDVAATTATGNNNVAAVGRKRKLPDGSPAPMVMGTAAAITNSMAPPEPVVPAVAALHHRHTPQQQQQPPQQQLNHQVAQQQLNLNFSARGIVQLPPMFSSQPIAVGTNNANFVLAQPISVATTGGTFGSQPISVATGSGPNNGLSLLGTDYFSGSAVGGAAAAQQQAPHPRPAQAQQQQQLPFQVASLGVPQHPQHRQNNLSSTLQGAGRSRNNAGDLSSSAASLMSQIALQPQQQQQAQVQQRQVQQQHQVQQQAQQQSNELFPAFQLNSSQFNSWNRAAATAVLPQAHLAAGASRAVVPAPSGASRIPQVTAASRAAAAASVPGSNASPPGASSVGNADPRSQMRNRPPAPPSKRGGCAAQGKPAPPSFHAPGVSEDESERQKRRSERNLREQERSHRITERIAELREVLGSAGVAFKPDRYSTLVSVVEYIKQLQGKSVRLDEEHRKLLDTISGADRLVKSGGIAGGHEVGRVGVLGNVGSGVVGGIIGSMDAAAGVRQTHLPMEATSSNSSSSDTHSNTDEEFLTFVRGIDYKSIFARCGVALAIASVDGRFVDCNEEFLRITDYSRVELLGEDSGGARRRKSVLPHPRGSSAAPRVSGGGQGKAATVSASAASSAPTAAARAAPAAGTPDVHTSGGRCSGGIGDRPPPEIHMRKHHHLSLFNLLGGEDMETVYAAMSRMLRAPESPAASQVASVSSRFAGPPQGRPHAVSSSASGGSGKGPTITDDGGGTSSSSDSCVKSDLTRSTEENSSSGNEVMNEDAEDGTNSGVGDHWTGRVKHTRRKDHMLQLNISLVRTADGRPKFFNCALSEVE